MTMTQLRFLTTLASAVLLVVVAVGCSKPEPAAPALPAISLEEMATTFVNHLVAAQYDLAVESFDETMVKLMPASALKAAWDSVIVEVGEFTNIIGTRTAKHEGYDLVFVTCRFADATLDIQLTFDDRRQVAGLFFRPTVQAETYNPPAYADADSFTEVELVVGSGNWQLPATLTMPRGEGPFPVAVLVHGSGPHDRDETIGANKPFRDLAWGLATNGIAVLRYEKRTKEYAAELAAMMETLTVQQETIDDVVAAVDLLGEVEGVNAGGIFVLGHSLGGMLAPRLAVKESRFAGLIILAGPTRSLEDLVLEQITYLSSLDGEIDASEEARIQETKGQVRKVKELDIASGEVVLGASEVYWQDLADYSPAQIARSLATPMLILQGERDYQVTMQDFEGWGDALGHKDNVTLKSYAGLNHLFVSGTGKSTPEEYSVPGNVAQIVVDDIVAWIGRNTQR